MLQVVSPSVWSLVPLLRELQQFSVVQRRLERQLVVFYRQQYQQQLQLEPELEWQRQPAEQQQQVQRVCRSLCGAVALGASEFLSLPQLSHLVKHLVRNRLALPEDPRATKTKAKTKAKAKTKIRAKNQNSTNGTPTPSLQKSPHRASSGKCVCPSQDTKLLHPHPLSPS